MGRKKNPTSEMDVGEKMKTPLAQNLGKLITDANALKDHLGCSIQAINQYRLGVSRPSLENLCKIADFYGVSTDYLLGLSDIPTNKPDIQAACLTTGLAERSVKLLNFYKTWGIADDIEVIDFLLLDAQKRVKSHHYRSILDLLHFFLSYDDKQPIKKQIFSNGAVVDYTDNDGSISKNAVRLNERIVQNAVLMEIEQALMDLKKFVVIDTDKAIAESKINGGGSNGQYRQDD